MPIAYGARCARGRREALRSTQKHSEALRSNQQQSAAISSNHKQSVYGARCERGRREVQSRARCVAAVNTQTIGRRSKGGWEAVKRHTRDRLGGDQEAMRKPSRDASRDSSSSTACVPSEGSRRQQKAAYGTGRNNRKSGRRLVRHLRAHARARGHGDARRAQRRVESEQLRREQPPRLDHLRGRSGGDQARSGELM